MLVIIPATARSGRSQLPNSATATIVDTLGAATPTTKFSVFGSGGVSIFGSQFVGPEFSLTEPTTITEIGGFVNNGVPENPSPPPFVVQIRAAINGVPDSSSIIASFALSNDGDPLLVSYESVQPNFVLAAGTFYALFATQSADSGGGLLGTASSPFQYTSGLTNMGFLDVTTGIASATVSYGAVRILGISATFNICIQDDSSGDLFRFNSTTGDYQFTNCSGFTLSGTGSLIKKGSIITLQHYAADRRILARIDTSVNKGTVSIQVFSQGTTFTITDRNTANSTCACAGT